MQVHWRRLRKDVVVVLALASKFTSAAFLPASTLLFLNMEYPLFQRHRRRLQAALPLNQNAQANTICGYWSGNGSTYTISCGSNVPCVFENIDQTAAVGFCSDATSPITAAFDYGDGVCSFSGARNGQLCCSSASPFFGEYLFNHGSSAFLTCDTTRFSINATTALPKPVNASATTTVSSSQPTQTQGNNTTSSGSFGKWATIGIVVGVISGIVTIIGVPFAIVRYLRHRSRPKPSSNRIAGPNHLHFHGPVHLRDCKFQGIGAGEGSREALLSYPGRGLLRNSSVHTID